MRISEWSSEVCSSDLEDDAALLREAPLGFGEGHPVSHAVVAGGAAFERAAAPKEGACGPGRPAKRRRRRSRSEERRRGKECVSTCRSRSPPSNSKNKHD